MTRSRGSIEESHMFSEAILIQILLIVEVVDGARHRFSVPAAQGDIEFMVCVLSPEMPPLTQQVPVSPRASTVLQAPQASVSEVNGLVSAMAIEPINMKTNNRCESIRYTWFTSVGTPLLRGSRSCIACHDRKPYFVVV